eukprot:41583-Rhodomonas_salina.1
MAMTTCWGQQSFKRRSTSRSGQGGTEPIYTLKWVGYPHSQNTEATHTFLEQEPGGRTAIKAWQARLAAIPTPAVKDRAAKH